MYGGQNTVGNVVWLHINVAPTTKCVLALSCPTGHNTAPFWETAMQRDATESAMAELSLGRLCTTTMQACQQQQHLRPYYLFAIEHHRKIMKLAKHRYKIKVNVKRA